MSFLSDILNRNVRPGAGEPGVTAELYTGQQRSFFLRPEVRASALATILSPNSHIRGKSKSINPDGGMYPFGYTPEVDYYVDKNNKNPITGMPIERGVIPDAGVVDANGRAKYGVPRDTNDILYQDVVNAYDAFKAGSDYEYRYRLDRGEIPVGVKLTKDSDIYLSSFTETDNDNEDPVSFGYDIIIDYDNSPLFNGAVEDFINSFSSYKELSSRKDILTKFKEQFFKFFEINTQNLLGLDQPRTYYLQKLSGLDELSESISSSDKPKQFVDYGKDLLTLTLREDVSINTGYLAALYKFLTWSRVHGKKMIPDNLLRFDMEIIVTEMRKFNRVRKNGDNTLDQYADLISRYRYKLYECQFFFEKMSHGNDIDMTSTTITDGYDIRINYKYTTLRFEKFTDADSTMIGSDIVREHVSIDNSLVDLSQIDPKNSKSFTINNNSIILNPIDYVLNKYTPVGGNTTYNPIGINQNRVKQTTNPIDILKQTSTKTNDYQIKLDNMNLPKISTITHQNTLLQQTLKNIQSSFGTDLRRTIRNLKQEVLEFIPKNFLGGFTEDGYVYNIPAYYINKAFNTANNTLKKSLDSVRRDIYEQKNVYVQTQLMNINNFIDSGNNLLNNELGKFGGHRGNNTKGKPNNIYGNGSYKKYVPTGSNTSSDDAPLTPPHNTGTPFDIYDI